MLVLPALVSPGYAHSDGPEQARGNGVQFRGHDIEYVATVVAKAPRLTANCAVSFDGNRRGSR
jgi:hypothetical protein